MSKKASLIDKYTRRTIFCQKNQDENLRNG